MSLLSRRRESMPPAAVPLAEGTARDPMRVAGVSASKGSDAHRSLSDDAPWDRPAPERSHGV